jgi:WW domain-binding protein 2
MALNVPVTHGLDGPFPLPFPGEVFVLTRDKIDITVKDAHMNLKSLKGRLFVTSLRMVFMPSDPTRSQNCQSLEMPFRGLWDEFFHQPIFAVNNLTATIQYYDEQPFSGTLTIKLEFREGGVNTFLPVFNNLLRATRAQLAMESRAAAGIEPPPIPAYAPGAPQSPNEYMPGGNSAFVDPTDPSRIFTTQPVAENNELRDNVPAWSASGGGMRNRFPNR